MKTSNRIIYTDDPSLINVEETDEYWFDDEVLNLKKTTEGMILAIAKVGTWRGSRPGYKLLTEKLLSNIMYAGNVDGIAYTTLYYDGHNVRKTVIHHDGTDHIIFREVRPNVNIDKLCERIYNGEYISNSTLNYYTRSLKRYVKNIYGW